MFDGTTRPVLELVEIAREEEVGEVLIGEVVDGNYACCPAIERRIVSRRPKNVVAGVGSKVERETKPEPGTGGGNLVVVPVVTLWWHVTLERVTVVKMEIEPLYLAPVQ